MRTRLALPESNGFLAGWKYFFLRSNAVSLSRRTGALTGPCELEGWSAAR
jgi:hypothetical protein